jgi:hypothetical protein
MGLRSVFRGGPAARGATSSPCVGPSISGSPIGVSACQEHYRTVNLLFKMLQWGLIWHSTHYPDLIRCLFSYEPVKEQALAYYWIGGELGTTMEVLLQLTNMVTSSLFRSWTVAVIHLCFQRKWWISATSQCYCCYSTYYVYSSLAESFYLHSSLEILQSRLSPNISEC